MGCSVSQQPSCELEPTPGHHHQHYQHHHTAGRGIPPRKVSRLPRAVDEEDTSDQEQDPNLPKEVMGRDLGSLMRDTAPRDHQYFSQDRATLKPAWTKRVQREWRILARGLPDDIHLRLYGDRMDIMRAALIGPKNTPYADALLFFDIHLSQNYPMVPPSVKFWSFGERINPNLYESGLVCLSLLGTWSGSGTEVWCPRKSTVLQVLVSILGLVLVEEPYFNEPGFERTRGTAQAEVHARQYSEKARLMSLRSMLRICQAPPGGFEDFSKGHFAENGESIVRRAENLLRPSEPAVGSVTNPDGTARSCAIPKRLDGLELGITSESFRRELAKVLPGLKGMHQRLASERAAALAASAANTTTTANGGTTEAERHASVRGVVQSQTGSGVGANTATSRLSAVQRRALSDKDLDGDRSLAVVGWPPILSTVTAAGA